MSHSGPSRSGFSARHVVVEGVVVRGHGVASGVSPSTPYPDGTITLQLPHFAARGLDLSGFHLATINVDISPRRFSLRRPTHSFPDVHWTDRHGPETFSFARCRLTRVGGRAVAGAREGSNSEDRREELTSDEGSFEGWIYYPHPETKPMHDQPPTVLELLMPVVPDLDYGDSVTLALDPEEVSIDHGM